MNTMENKKLIDWLGGQSPEVFMAEASACAPFYFKDVENAVEQFFNKIPNDENFTMIERIGWMTDPGAIKKEIAEYIWFSLPKGLKI
jgi:hypothetical protein